MYLLRYNKISWKGLSALFFCLGVVCIFFSRDLAHDDWRPHLLFVICSAVISLFQFSRLLNRDLYGVIIDMRWIMLLSFSLYFIFGGSLILFGSEYQVWRSMNFYSINPSLVMKVNGINAIGFSIVLFVSEFYRSNIVGRFVQKLAIELKSKKLSGSRSILLVLLISLPSWVIVFLHDLDTGVKAPLPGLLRQVSQLTVAYIFMAAIFTGNNRKLYLGIAILLAVVQALAGILIFNKTQVLLPAVSLLIGLAIYRRSLKAVFAVMILTVVSLSGAGNLSDFARVNYSGLGDIKSRLEILSSAALHTATYQEGDRYSTWNRLNYLNSQSAAVDLYDSGNGGDDYKKVMWIFVPRFLNEDKPIMTTIGVELYTKITGHLGSSEGTGIFVDGYYNLGWWGLTLGSILVGMIVSVLNSLLAGIFQNKTILLTPVGFMCLYMGFRLDGAMLGDYFGVFIIIAYSISFLYFILRLSRGG